MALILFHRVVCVQTVIYVKKLVLLIDFYSIVDRKRFLSLVLCSLNATEDAVFAEPSPGGGTMMAGAVYTLPAQRNVPLPVAMQRLIPMATQGGKPRSFTLPRDSNLHTLLTPPAKEEQQTRNGECSQEHKHVDACKRRESTKRIHVAL